MALYLICLPLYNQEFLILVINLKYEKCICYVSLYFRGFILLIFYNYYFNYFDLYNVEY